MRFKLTVVLTVILLVWGMAYLLWEAYQRPTVGIDDANIYQVYMRNLAQGQGMVFQAGGEKVEGFTSVLWVLIGSALYRLGLPFETGLMIVSTLMVTVLLARIGLVGTALEGSKRRYGTILFFLLLLTLVPGYFDWMLLSLMETALWSLLLTLLSLEVATSQTQRPVRLGVLLALLVLTRPESLLWGPIFLLLYHWRLRWLGLSPGRALRRLSWPAGIFAATAGGLVVWRLWYFGFPLPNTYYAKVSSDWFANFREGVLYLARFLFHSNPALAAAFGLILAWMWQVFRQKTVDPKDRSLMVLAIISLANLLFPVVTGGDHFALGRPLQALLPITWLVFSLLFFRLLRLDLPALPLSMRQAALALGFLGAAALMPGMFRVYHYAGQRSPLQKEFALAEEGRALGEGLNKFFQPLDSLPSVGVICAGGTGYAYQGPTFDLLGLNLVMMAHAQRQKPTGRRKNHASFHPAVFYRLQPDLFLATQFVSDTAGFTILENLPDQATDFYAEAVGHIYRDRLFRDLYQPAFLQRLPDGPVLHSYFRRKFLERLNPRDYRVITIQ